MDISEEYRIFDLMKKTGSKIYDSGFLLSLLFFILWVGLPRHQPPGLWHSKVFEKPSHVQWLKDTVDPQQENLPLEMGDDLGNMGEQPDDDDGNHFYHDLLEGLSFWSLSLFSFSADTYPAVNQDILLPPPKV